MDRVRTRLVERRDAEAMRAIYNLEVLESTVTFDLVPRTLADQVAWIDEHSGGHPAIVAVDGDGDGRRVRVADARTGPGPRTRRRSRTRSTCAATAAAQGIGRLLLGDLVDLARDHGFHSVIGAHRRRPRRVDRAARGVRLRADRHASARSAASSAAGSTSC